METLSTSVASARRDTPGVLLPPPLIPLSMLAVGAALQQVVSLGWLSRLPHTGRIAAGTALAVVGATILILGVLALKRHGTNVNPYQPSLAIATGGIFDLTRNPIYVGGIALSAGLALTFALDWTLLLQPLGLLVLPSWHRFA